MNVQHQLIKNKKRNTASKQCFKHTALTLAVLGVMPLLSYQVQAACTGTLAAPVVGGMAATITTQCSGAAGSNITNTDATTYVDNATKTNVGGNTLIQLDGQGRMLINSGSIINNEVINTGTSAAGNRNRVAVLIGAATANNAAFTTTPSGGQTNINVPNATAAFVGQTVIIGRFDSIEGDLFAGDTRTITAIVSGAGTANAIVTLASPLASNPAPNGPQSLPLRYKVISNFGGGQDIINNSGTISTSITTAEINGNKAATGTTSVSNTSSSRAVTSSAEGSYMVNNSATGTIKATHAGIGATYAVEAGGAVIDMTINNNGLLQAERTATVSAATFIPTANPTGVVLGLAAQTLAQVNAINTQEELDAITINNSATGIIRATGDYSGAIYMRAGEQTINNAGLIEHTAGKPGFAIGSVSDGGEIRTFELTNIATGTINGDILAVNGNALRYYGLITGGVPAASTLGINNQFGEEQSDISNAGKINSNIYYANGAHDLENAVGGVITGNINVDQRDNKFAPTTATCTPSANTVCQAVGTTNTAFSTNTQRIQTITASGAPNSFGQPVTITTQFNIAGAKTFVLVNAGALNGNLTIVNGVASSAITNASIAGRVSNNAIENSGDWIGNLNITNVAGAINSITNEGTLTGNITLTDVAGALNTVNLSDNGFVGNIAAITGAGTNTLNIVGAGTSQGNVSKFSTINFVTDDYTIVAGNMFEANSASINAGNFKLLGNLIANTTVTSNATLMGNGTNIGSLTNSGAVNLADTTLNVTGDFISTAGASISTLITPTAFGVLATTGSATVTDTTVKPALAAGYAVPNGSTYNVITSSGLTATNNSIIGNSPLLTWSFVNDANNLVLKANVNAANVAGSTTAGIAVINNILANSNNVPAINDLGVALQGLTSSQAIAKAGSQLSPETNGAAYAGAQVAVNQFSQLITNHANVLQYTQLGVNAKLANAAGSTGISTGDAALNRGVWLQGFGFTGEQNKRRGADGYNVDTAGFAIGFDAEASDTLRYGVAVAYANGNIDATDATKGNTTDVDSYQVSTYGTYSSDHWLYDAQVGYAQHHFDSKRSVPVPVNDLAKSSYEGNQYFAKVGASYAYAYSKNVTFIPTITAMYSYFNQESYTEHSQSGVGLTVDSRNTDSIRTGLGGKLLFNIDNKQLPLLLETRAMWMHEFADVRQDTTARFAAGGSTFNVDGMRPARDSANLGLTLSASTIDSSQVLSISYDADVRSQYVGHTGGLTARFNF